MAHNNKTQLLTFLLTPVVRFALRHGVQYQEASQLMKSCFLKEAHSALEKIHKKVNVSSLSAATGLQRKDVEKIQNENASQSKTGIISKIITTWTLSKRFAFKNGKSKPLTYKGRDSEFVKLLHSVSTDLNPGTILSELERLKLVTKDSNKVSLKTEVLCLGDEPEEIFQVVSDDADALINAVEQNITSNTGLPNGEIPHLHGTTYFTNIDSEKVNTIKAWLLNEGSLFHNRARKFLSAYDLDINPDKKSDTPKRETIKVRLGTFSFVEKENEDE